MESALRQSLSDEASGESSVKELSPSAEAAICLPARVLQAGLGVGSKHAQHFT